MVFDFSPCSLASISTNITNAMAKIAKAGYRKYLRRRVLVIRSKNTTPSMKKGSNIVLRVPLMKNATVKRTNNRMYPIRFIFPVLLKVR